MVTEQEMENEGWWLSGFIGINIPLYASIWETY
jgi:hypothetical protein